MRMERERRVHHDERGAKRPLSTLPASISDLRDDPYQSLATFARKAGGYRKSRKACSDFKWVDFFRARIAIDLSSPGGFALALLLAVKLAQTRAAKGMPGFRGRR
ncbi:unnamed protein product [Candidatus Paraburkholderia kirkii UZHbot1]|uniref:WGS project CAFE00000000 data, contig bkir_c39 n=1 Tax=Candidatus Paraburkholderia kirkii UZHbot1 TaxID=1055526 RepID=U3UAV8_9BURK|nr:unnamed protein product [Candidatus Paraburkholderia kirkii UZHbot1]